MRLIPEFPQGSHPDEIRILMLEDDAAFAALVRAHLDRVGWARISLEWVDTLAGALERLAKGGFDLILSDLHVPDSNGLQTLESLARASDRLIIAMTGERAEGLRESALEHGAYDLVAKDRVDRVELERLVRLGAMQANTFRSLRESEARFRSLVIQSWDWYWEQDEDLRYTRFEGRSSERAREEFDKALGRRRWEFPGLVPVSETWEEHRAKLEARTKFRDFEYSWHRADGQRRYMSVRGEPIFDAGGTFRGYRGVATDITRRKEAEAERRRLDATHAALNAANEIILRAKTPDELLGRACAVAVEAGGFLIGNIFALDADGTGLSCVASSGPRAGLGKSVKQSIDASEPGGQGLIGLACRTQAPVISNDYQQDERTRLREAWRGAPIGSIGVFPLFAEDKLAGAFAVQHEKTNAITAELAALVQRLADNVSLALDKFRREKALRESEERFRQLTALSSDWYWEQDTSFRFTRISKGADSAVQSRSLGKARWELPGFDLAQGTWEEHRALLERHEPFRNMAMRARQPDGSLRHVSVSAQPIFDETGRFRGYRGTTRDITANVRAEEALRRFRLAMDYSADVIVLVDRPSMKFVDVNQTFCRLLGYSREELLAMGPEDILPASREELERAYDALIADPGKPGGMKSYYRCKDGSKLPFESTRHVLRSGDTWLVAAISRDIRERLASERALRESEERFRGLTELSSDWYWEQDRDFRFVRMSGRVKPEVVAARLGKTCWEMESDEPVSGTWEEHRALVWRHEPYKDLLLRCGRADGSHGYVSVSAQPVFENGEFMGYRGSTRDVTERIRAEEDLRRFRLALDNSADLIFLIDPQAMKYVDANATACRLLGYSRDELLAMGPHDVVPVDRETIRKSYEDLMSGSSADSVMHGTYRCKDGSSLPFESTRHVMRSAGRSVIAAISRDIRERMATDAALRDSEGRFRALTELSSDAFWEQDAEYRFTSITRKGAWQGGDASAGMIGKRRWELSFFNLSEAEWQAHRAVLDARLPFHDLELGMLGDNGEQIWFSTSGEPVFDAHGRFKGYRGLSKGISVRKREERLLGLEHSVARYLADADSAERALPEVMAVICRSEQWECARYFELDEAADKMRLRASWTDGSERLARFIAGSAKLAYGKGDGLVGMVWRTGAPLWVEDASRDPRVAMKGLAESAGLHAALVVPVTFEGAVMGVFSLSNAKVIRPDDRLLRALEVIGAQMGQFLQRKQAEQELRESEARFRSLTSLSSDFFWQTDAQHRIKEVVHGPRHSPILESATGKARWELPFTSPEAAGWASHKATMEGRQPFRDFEFGRIDGKGIERHLSISGEPIFGSGGDFLGYRGVGRDITDRRRAEQGLKLEHTVTRALADADSAAAALKAVMRSVCEIEGWECGRYFDRDNDVFRLSESWHLPSRELEQFISYSTEKEFPLGIGIVGRAGAGEPQWVADVSLDARVVSRPMASVHGMRAAFMFPVTSQGRSMGVLSFTNREIREPDERLLKAVRVIGSQIGQFLARKQVEQALGEEEARFRRTFELAATGIAHVALGGQYLRVNRRLCEILGYDEAELLGRSVKSISHPDDTGRIDALRVRLHSGELPSVRAEKRYVRKDGKLVWVDVNIALVRNADASPQHEIAVYEDITERKQTEEALRESELRSRNLSELSSDWFWEQDADLRFTRLYGKSKLSDAMIGKQRWEAPGVDPQAPEWREHIGALERRERFRDFEYSHLGRDGRRVHVRASGYPLFDADGKFAGYRGLARNVTRQRESKEELRRFRTALDASADMIMLFDVRTLTLIDFNETTCYFLGYARDELLGASFEVLLCDMPLEAMRASLEHLTLRKDGSDFTVRTYRRKNGTTFEVEVLRRIVDSPDGPILVLNARDLTERRRAEERQAAHLRYQEATARFGHLALAKHDAGALIDDAVLSVQAALQGCALAYVERASSEGVLMVRGSAGLPDGEHASEAQYGAGDTISRILDAGEMAVIDGSSGAGGPLAFDWAGEFQSMVAVPVHGSGEVRGVLCALSRSSEALGPEESKFLTAAASLLSAGLLRIDSEDRLAFLAQFDALTGLPNRALLRDRFSQMIVQARRHATPLGVLFIDLDDFKLVNDSLGHAGGDDLLKQVAQRLQAGVRPGDTVARISGDEFAVILGDLAKAEDSALVAQKIIDRVGLPMQVRGQEVFVTASVGIAAFPADGDDADALLAAADAAMYRAKQSGRNGFQFFTVEINQRMRARAQLGSELRRALERGEFRLAYQPKYDLRTGMPCAAEALLRWEHPERGTVMPGEFIPVLEETGMIVAAGEWVLRTVCEDLKAWKADGVEPLPVALNLSARQFREQRLDERIIELVRGAGVEPALIELEITESQLMQDPDHAIRVVRALNDAGIRIAIDDFGTGYSSLTYLSRFHVSSLKIDRSFVADLMTDPADATIVRTIIDMAHTLGFTVVAEGVETKDQASFLRALGCEQAQGYLFARPMPEAQFRQLLHAGQLADMNG